MHTLDDHGIAVQIDDHGFLLNGAQWTPEIAEILARDAGIATLNERHWTVLARCREEAARRGSPPGPDRIAALSGLGPAELEELFPGARVGVIARIAGFPPPRQDVRDQP